MVEATATRSSTHRRCPACHEALEAGQPSVSCPEEHLAIHADCVELTPTCPALGCEAPLRPAALPESERLGRWLLIGGLRAAERQERPTNEGSERMWGLLLLLLALDIAPALVTTSSWSPSVITVLMLGAALLNSPWAQRGLESWIPIARRAPRWRRGPDALSLRRTEDAWAAALRSLDRQSAHRLERLRDRCREAEAITTEDAQRACELAAPLRSELEGLLAAEASD